MPRSARRAELVAGAALGVLILVTLGVWRGQVEQQRRLLSQYSDDLAFQASRRLQVFMQSHLRIVEVFAARWATHEAGDFSSRRFAEFSAVMTAKLPGYVAISLAENDGRRETHPTEADHSAVLEESMAPGGLESGLGAGEVSFLPPRAGSSGAVSLFLVAPLVRDGESLGRVVVELAAGTLIDDCFRTQIRSVYDFRLAEGQTPIYQFTPDGGEWLAHDAGLRSMIDFPIANRTWTLTVAPRKEILATASWTANLAVPALGLPLSVGLSCLVWLLLRRMEMLRAARDRALREVEERRRAEVALQVTEGQYRDVFSSTTDGLLVLEPTGVIVDANAAAGDICGAGARTLRGRDVREFVAATQVDAFGEYMRQLLDGGRARLDSVVRQVDGREVPVEVRGARLIQSEGEPTRLLAVLTDVGERQRAFARQAQLSRKVLMAQEEERARLSRELHDELGQILTALRLEMGLLAKALASGPSSHREYLANSAALVERSTEELRRICRALRPAVLDDLGLEPAVRTLVGEFRERTGIIGELEVGLEEHDGCIRPEVALAVYRVMQEALNNISRHAKTDRFAAVLRFDDEALSLAVEDRGVGFDAATLGSQSSCGLEGMRERAHLVGAELTVASTPGVGTRVSLRVPNACQQKEGRS